MIIKLEKTTFELLRKIQNTYYIIVRLDQGDLQTNENLKALTVKRFIQEIDFTLRREVTNLPVKRQRLILDNKIKLEELSSNVSASLLNFFLELQNRIRQMAFVSSIQT